MQMHRIDKGTVEERRGVTFTGFMWNQVSAVFVDELSHRHRLIEASDKKQQTPIQQILPALSDQATSNTVALLRMARDMSGIHAMVQTLQENVLDVQNLLDDLQTTPAAMPASATPLSSFMAQQPGTQAGSRLSQHTTASFESWSNLRDTSRTTVTMRFQGHIAAFATQARPSSRTSHGTPYNGLVPRKTRLGT